MLKGIIPAMITPSSHGTVSIEQTRAYVKWLAKQAVDGIFALGTTGEGILLPDHEWEDVVRAVVQTADGLPVAVQCGTLSLEATLRRIEFAEHSRASAVAVLTPFFYRYSDAALLKYYTEVLQTFPNVKFYLYNIPKYTNNLISTDVYQRLASQFTNLLGIKDSSGSVESLEAYVRAVPYLDVLSGSDSTLTDAHRVGAKGIVSGVASALPSLVVSAWQAIQVGDGQQADLLRSVTKAFHKTDTITAARATLALQGWQVGETFYAHAYQYEEVQQQLGKDLADLGVHLDLR